MNDSYARKKILVTGGSGFLGWHLANNLKLRHQVAHTYSSNKISIPKCQEYHLDIYRTFSIENCLNSFQPDVIVHTAAQADTSFCERNPEEAFFINSVGTERILRRLRNPKTLFIFISTDLVFSGNRAPYRESNPMNPICAYGKSKQSAEETVRRHWPNHLIVRTALMYGASNPIGRGSFLQWLDGALARKETLNLFTDEYRTPAYVMDVVKAVGLLIDRGFHYRTFHIGGPERLSRYDFGLRLAPFLKCDASSIKPTKLSDIPAASHRAPDVSLDSNRIQNTCLFRLTPIDSALKQIYNTVKY